MSTNSESPAVPSIYAMDKPTRVAHLGYRLGYTFVAWIFLAFGIVPGNSFFVSLFLYFVPLFMDYMRFVPDTPFRRWDRRIGIFLSGVWLVFAFIGICGVITAIQTKSGLMVAVSPKFLVDSGASFPLEFVWYCISINVVLTGVDWIVHETGVEKWLRDIFMRKPTASATEGMDA